MILVSVGTNEARFDRLLGWVAQLDGREELVVQHGPSRVRSPHARHVDYLPFDELVALVRASRVFVTHAGVGSIIVALTAGRRPIVASRLKQLGEAVDDHQVSLANRLEAEGLVTVVHSANELADAVARQVQVSSTVVHVGALARDLRAYLLEHCPMPEAQPPSSS
jgi:UDP-N-acetylglucosamine transferase subunit ALG13